MFIKQPAFVFGEDEHGDPLPVVWSANPDDHNQPMFDDGVEVARQLYLTSVIMQEFGHTAGLDDLQNAPDDYGKCLMCQDMNNYKELNEFTSIPAGDAKYLNQNQRRDEDD